MALEIREATDQDFEAIWPIFQQIVLRGDTYPYAPNTNKSQAYQLWMTSPHKTFVAVEDGQILGTYFIKANQPGLGGHVCNCGYMVAEQARGRGIATQLCEHSQREAQRLGYKAMQFNLVAVTNEAAVYLWQKLGFEIVGRLPKAFNHQTSGLVDAFVLYKWLDD